VAVITFAAFIYLQLQHAPTSIDLNFEPPGRTMIYSSDGTLLAKLFVENRKVVPISQIPADLQNATVAFEDKRFYTHSGIDIQGIGRSLYRNVRNGDLKGQGGSTITQQLARNMGIEGLTREKSIQRKWHEWMVAIQIEKSYTKQRILEMYLNQVSYGQGTYGVEAAAQTYFGKDVSKLDLAQCALLAGLPNRPTVFNPYKDKDAAKTQRDIVLSNMLAQHMITPAQFAKATSEYIHLAAPKPPSQGSEIYHAQYFVDYVVEQLKKRYGPKALLDGNMQIETTLNWPMQQIADQAVASQINAGASFGPNQAALVAMDPKTGEIKAMVGGVDYKTNQFNIAAHGRRQPGSTFKAVVYSAAIDSGAVRESTTVLDARTVFHLGGKPYIPRDDGRYTDRYVGLREAMAQSINVPAIKVINLIRPTTAVQYARMMGVTSPLDPVLSLALGSSPVTPLEMADVYATIAAGGNHPEPTPFTRISDLNGKTLEDIPPAVETKVLKSSTVQQVDDMLRAVVTDGTGKVVGDVPDARGKTGTTQGHKDVWFVGYTPQLVCAVWAGHPLHDAKTGRDAYGADLGDGAWGMTVCGPIWRNFMLKAGPIYAAALAKEAARNKPAQKAKPVQIANPDANISEHDQDENSYRDRHYRHHRRSDYGDGDGTDNTPAITEPTDNPDGTTPVSGDNGGGTPDTLPTTNSDTSPTVTPSPSNDGNTDDSSGQDSPAPRRRTHHGSSPDDPSNSGDVSAPFHSLPDDSGDGGTSHDTPAPPRRHVSEPPKLKKPEYVTVRVNPDDGKLATQWTPEAVDRQYVKGTEPHSYSHMYKPPPGEH
jgi:penicillin-binding protein 1A